MNDDYTRQNPMYVSPPPVPRKKRKPVFLVFFLLVQVLFLIWLIAGIASTSHTGADAHAQAVAQCSGTQWQPLYKSYSDCVTQLGNLYNNASDAGKGIGAGLVIGLWVAADVILGIGRFVVLFTRRHS